MWLGATCCVAMSAVSTLPSCCAAVSDFIAVQWDGSRHVVGNVEWERRTSLACHTVKTSLTGDAAATSIGVGRLSISFNASLLAASWLM